ncbi:MAG: HEAT repeat domain-containing protein [Deltaproteobacteria bacterium]|nr:HEAT repeat domain-containing protein [Deltaproteobacteria bacterium]
MVDDLESVIEKALGGDGASRAKVRGFEPADVVPKLVAQFTSPKTKIRTNAIGMATGIASFAKLVPLDQLLGALADPDAEVRLATAVGLKRAFPTEPHFKPQAEQIRPALAPCLKDSDPRVREQAGHAWRALGLG